MNQNKKKRQKQVAFVVVLLSLAVIIWKLNDETSSVTFFTPAEVYANPAKFNEKSFRVSGLVVQGSKKWDADSRLLQFAITDLKGNDFTVAYKGMPPDLFKEGQGVVIEGRLQNSPSMPKHINASLLMVKHSEVYDTKEDHSDLRKARLLDSMEQKPLAK